VRPAEPSDDDPPVDVGVDAGEVAVDAPGADEVAVIAWPLVWRARLQDRASSSERYPWVVLAASLFGLFAVGFTITVLSISIPDIARDLGTTSDVLTWVITGPILAYAVIGPIAGKLADVRGARRVYLASLVAVTVFAAFTAIAWDAASLISFRVLGAAVGAAVGPSSLAIINKLFPPHKRAQALGYWSLVAAGGPVIGVVAGGPMVEAIGWRAIFAIQVPLTLLALLVAFLILPETERRTDVKLDLAGSTLLALGVGTLLVALNRGPSMGWSSPLVLAGFALCPVFIVAFVLVERRVSHPLIPLRYFKRRNFAFPIANQFFTNFAYMGGFIITPLLLQEELGFGEAKTGFLSIARPLTFAIAGPVAGYITTRTGERLNAVVGSIFIVLSMLGLAMVGASSSDLLIVGALALSGVGMGTTAPAMAAAVANAVDESDLGVVAAAQQMMAQVGVVAGIQILQTVQAAREPAVGGIDSYHAAYLVGALVAGLGVVAACFVRSYRRPVPASEREWDARTGAPREALEPA
jgi:EmrB/QacA subfamily drug resistance transporter